MSDGSRTAVIFDAYPHVYGGAQRTDHLLARDLPTRGWTLTVITPGAGPFTDRLAGEGLPAQVVATPRALGRYGRATTGVRAAAAAAVLPVYWIRLARALRRLAPDVVHVVDHRGLVLAGLPARASGARVVWHVQAMDRGRPLNRMGARLAHCVVVPTRAVVAKMPDLARAKDLRAIANVVPDHVREVAGSPLGAVVTSTGRLHPDKGFDVLLEAFRLVADEVPDVRLRIIGGDQEGFPTLREELEGRAARLHLGDAVELVGFVDHPEQLVADSACYVQAAREQTEILPLAVLEAMASGAPVVATDVGGVRDVVRDGETGLLTPPEDAPALARAILRILQDQALADRLRRSARTLTDERRFTVAGLLDGFVAAYEGTPHG